MTWRHVVRDVTHAYRAAGELLLNFVDPVNQTIHNGWPLLHTHWYMHSFTCTMLLHVHELYILTASTFQYSVISQFTRLNLSIYKVIVPSDSFKQTRTGLVVAITHNTELGYRSLCGQCRHLEIIVKTWILCVAAGIMITTRKMLAQVNRNQGPHES